MYTEVVAMMMIMMVFDFPHLRRLKLIMTTTIASSEAAKLREARIRASLFDTRFDDGQF